MRAPLPCTSFQTRTNLFSLLGTPLPSLDSDITCSRMQALGQRGCAAPGYLVHKWKVQSDRAGTCYIVPDRWSANLYGLKKQILFHLLAASLRLDDASACYCAINDNVHVTQTAFTWLHTCLISFLVAMHNLLCCLCLLDPGI